MGFDGLNDLEYGGAFLKEKYRFLVSVVTRHGGKVRRFSVAFLVITLAILVRYGVHNVQGVIEAATAITLDEESYVPLGVNTKVLEKVPHGRFPIRDSMVNRRMQVSNLGVLSEHVQGFLESSGNVCAHLSEFGVPYNILVFPNLTLVNAEIISEGLVRHNVLEVDLRGERAWASRAGNVYIKYYNCDLENLYVTLYGERAYCFAFYMM